MKYKCLVFDHDDTAVNSTATIHYPCFVKFMKEYRKGQEIPDLDTYIRLNFDPGVLPFFHDYIGLSDEEMIFEQNYWNEYASHHTADAYPGIREIMEEQKAAGGHIAVVSHSYRENILRDYAKNGFPLPDLIFGWEQPKPERKPSPHALFEIMRTFDLQPSDLLVIDDLKPGYDMAHAAGVPFAAAGWSYDIPEIESFMRAHSDRYFKTVAELQNYLRE